MISWLLSEFHSKGRLSKQLGASFSALILKRNGAESIMEFRPISLIRSLYKILSQVPHQ